MAAFLKCTGPAWILVGTPVTDSLGSGITAVSPIFLGSTKETPRYRKEANFEPVMNDIGGREPMDDSYQGRSAMIELLLNKWDNNIALALDNVNLNSAPPGIDLFGDVGTLVIQEGKFIPVWLLFPYGASSIFPKASMNDLPPGYFFPACHLETNVGDQLGTKPYQLQLVFKARRLFNLPGETVASTVGVTGAPYLGRPTRNAFVSAALARAGCPAGGSVLYSTNPAAFNGITQAMIS